MGAVLVAVLTEEGAVELATEGTEEAEALVELLREAVAVAGKAGRAATVPRLARPRGLPTGSAHWGAPCVPVIIRAGPWITVFNPMHALLINVAF